MKSSVRYFAVTDDNDKPYALGKVVSTGLGLFGYVLSDREWIEDRSILECLFDQTAGEEVDEAEAHRIATTLGGTLKPL